MGRARKAGQTAYVIEREVKKREAITKKPIASQEPWPLAESVARENY